MNSPTLYEICIGAIIAILGYLLAQLNSDVRQVIKDLSDYKTIVAKEYADKDDIKELSFKLDTMDTRMREQNEKIFAKIAENAKDVSDNFQKILDRDHGSRRNDT